MGEIREWNVRRTAQPRPDGRRLPKHCHHQGNFGQIKDNGALMLVNPEFQLASLPEKSTFGAKIPHFTHPFCNTSLH